MLDTKTLVKNGLECLQFQKKKKLITVKPSVITVKF